ncbi:DNA-3-methyladenine glycosylase, partial [Pseudomonas otitidis]
MTPSAHYTGYVWYRHRLAEAPFATAFGRWLSARIIETEAYYLAEKGSHASLGYTEKRRALFL